MIEEPVDKSYWNLRQIEDIILEHSRDLREIESKVPNDVNDPLINSMITEFKVIINEYISYARECINKSR